MTLEHGLDLEIDLLLRREHALAALHLTAQPLTSARITSSILTVSSVEDFEQMLSHAIVQVLATQMCVA